MLENVLVNMPVKRSNVQWKAVLPWHVKQKDIVMYVEVDTLLSKQATKGGKDHVDTMEALWEPWQGNQNKFVLGFL